MTKTVLIIQFLCIGRMGTIFQKFDILSIGKLDSIRA